jgi:hypothetical protein
MSPSEGAYRSKAGQRFPRPTPSSPHLCLATTTPNTFLLLRPQAADSRATTSSLRISTTLLWLWLTFCGMARSWSWPGVRARRSRGGSDPNPSVGHARLHRRAPRPCGRIRRIVHHLRLRALPTNLINQLVTFWSPLPSSPWLPTTFVRVDHGPGNPKKPARQPETTVNNDQRRSGNRPGGSRFSMKSAGQGVLLWRTLNP